MNDKQLYRSTRNPGAGTYYRRLTEKQVRAALGRWRRRYLSGKLSGQEMCQLMAYQEHPEWCFWRRYVRIRNENGLREVACVVVLPPSSRFRPVKNKPAPVK